MVLSSVFRDDRAEHQNEEVTVVRVLDGGYAVDVHPPMAWAHYAGHEYQVGNGGWGAD